MNKTLVVCYRNLLLKIFQIPSGMCLKTWKTLHRGPVTCMCFLEEKIGENVGKWTTKNGVDDENASEKEGNSPENAKKPGNILATGSADYTVRLWDLGAGYCTHCLRGMTSIVTCVQFVTRHCVMYAGMDGKMVVAELQVKGSRQIAAIGGHTSAVTGLAVFGGFVVSAGKDQVVNLWNTNDWTLVKSFPVLEPVSAMIGVENHGDGELKNSEEFEIVFGCDSGRLEYWSFDSARVKVVKKLTSAGTAGTAISEIVAFSALENGEEITRYVVTTETQNIVLLNSDFSKWKSMAGFNDEVLDIALMPSENALILASNSPQLRVYNQEKWGCHILDAHTDLVVGLSSFDRTWPGVFASCSKDNTLAVWKMDKNEKSIIFTRLAVATGHTATVTAMKFCNRGPDHFLASVSDDTTLKVWNLPKNLPDEKDVKLESAGTVVAHAKDVSCVDVSPNDKLIATGSMDKLAKIWHVAMTGKRTRVAKISLAMSLTGHKRGVWDVKFSRKDQVVVTGSGDFEVKIWALVDGACIRTFEGHESAVVNVRFMPSGLQILSSDTQGLLKLWTIKTNECVKTWDNHEGKIWALEVNEEGSKVYTGSSDSKLLVWRDVTERELEAEMADKSELLDQEQKLSNYLQSQKFAKALKLAINLDRPFTSLTVIKKLLSTDDGKSKMTQVISNFDQTVHERLLKYAIDWNANSKNCHIAQLIVEFVFRSYRSDQLLQFVEIENTLEALLPYSERHFERMTRLKQDSTFVDFVHQNMGRY